MQPPGEHAAAAQEVLAYGIKWEYTGVTGLQREAYSAARLDPCSRTVRKRKENVYVTFLRNDFQERQEDNANGASSRELRTGNGCSVLAGRGSGEPGPQHGNGKRLVSRGADPLARDRRL